MTIKKIARIIAVMAMAAIMILPATARKSHDAAVGRGMTTFNSIVKELEMNYVDSLRTDESFRAAIDAMLATVDPYTEYYDANDYEKLEKMTTGEYGGIGSYIMQRDGKTYISQPMEGSPAAEAGLRAGDWIISVDSVDTSQKTSDFVTKLLRGQPGTSVKVTVNRPLVADSILAFDIQRRKLQQPSVPYHAVIGDNTGYIALSSFIDKSPAEVRAVLEEFKADPRVKNIVLDLRGNGGGLIESAVDIVGNFVPKGTEVVSTKGRDASLEKSYKTTRNPIFPDMPLAILIDGGTASASEIVAGSLQDLDRAVLVGTRSFGKGLVQSTRPLPYSGILKITVAKYYIPSGRLLQAIDYSHRNPDGSAARVPDSLTRVFKTLHGREVRDGGGLQPDTVVDWGKANRLVYNAVADNWVFDYATKYVAENPPVSDISEFVVTDSIYAGFKRSIDPERFKYDRVCEELIKQLRKTAEEEGYMDDETKTQIDTLAKMLTHNLDHDLDTHRDELERYLGSEILSRWFYDRGKLAYELRHDPGLDTAIEILNNRDAYDKILGLKPKK